MNTENQDSKKYIVMVSDNYHFMDDEYSSKYGEYDNKDEAIKACKRIVEGSIDFVYGQTDNAVYKNYCMFGEDAYIIGDASFSSRDYAKEYCNKIVEKEPTYSIDRPTAYSICSEYFRTNDYSVETDENSSKYCRDLLIEINGMKHKIHHTYYDMGRDFAEYKRHYLLGGYYENKKNALLLRIIINNDNTYLKISNFRKWENLKKDQFDPRKVSRESLEIGVERLLEDIEKDIK